MGALVTAPASLVKCADSKTWRRGEVVSVITFPHPFLLDFLIRILVGGPMVDWD